MKSLLLCPPAYFDIEYEINPWMDMRCKADRARVLQEYATLKQTYARLAIPLYEMQPQPGLPDMVYTANIGYLHNRTLIQSNFKYAQRRPEAGYGCEFLESLFPFETVCLPPDIFFEGQGDLLTDGLRFFFGWGKRSSFAAKSHLERIVQQPVIDLELVDPYYYHLDTCFAPLSPTTVVINPHSFTATGRETIARSFETVIETNPQDNAVLACNLVCSGNQIIISSGISCRLHERFEQLDYTVHQVPMDEYRKGGGSVKCVSFEFELPQARA